MDYNIKKQTVPSVGIMDDETYVESPRLWDYDSKVRAP